MKLPTSFKTLDVSGFEIDRNVGNGITREMVDIACAVLQKNKVGIVARSVNAALKEIYGVGGNTDLVCKLLREWRADNLETIKGKSEKGLAQLLLEIADDGLLEESEIPEDFLKVFNQMAVAGFRLAYQKADTRVSGDRMKQLIGENEALRQQLKDFPQLLLEINFYKSEYEKQRVELKDAYMKLNLQQLADAEQFRVQIEDLRAVRSQLEIDLSIGNARIEELMKEEVAWRDALRAHELRVNEISRLNGQLEAREREISSLHSQVSTLQESVGEKQVLESQLTECRSQLASASQTITQLQSKSKKAVALVVD